MVVIRRQTYFGRMGGKERRGCTIVKKTLLPVIQWSYFDLEGGGGHTRR